MGVAMELVTRHTLLAPELRLLITTGFLGGLTTFSTFSAEVTTLFVRREWMWGMLTIGARPITLPLRITSMIFLSVLNSLRKVSPDSGGIVLSGDCGFGTPPRPFGPWQLMQPYAT